jgi:hypothetical protein
MLSMDMHILKEKFVFFALLMILKSAITDALITCDTFEIDEATSLSIILIYISQGRDIITVLLILCYSDVALINATCI